MMDQAEHLRLLMNEQQTDTQTKQRVIAVASGKGGVGKTNFCVNFALGLQKANHRPIVIDADVGFADVEVLLGVRPRKTVVDVIHGLSIWEALEYHSSGLAFLSAGNGLLDIQDLTLDQIDKLHREMQTLHDKFDYVIIDCGAGMGKNLSRLITAADDLVLVTTPEPTAIADCYALLKMLVARGNVPEAKLVVNRVQTFTEGRMTADKLRMVADKFLDVNMNVLGYLLEDNAIANAVMQQQALLTLFPASSAARCIDQLVKNYLNVKHSDARKGIAGFFDKLFRKRLRGDENSSHTA